MDEIRNVAQNSQMARIKSWLDPPEPSINYNQAREKFHDGTGSWFLRSECYVQWKAKTKQALWLHGIPGCGKTVLSSTVIADLKIDGAPVLYFYFDFNDPDKQTFEKLVRSLISQLYQQAQGSRKYAEQLYSSCKDGNEQPQTQVLLKTLHSMIDATRGVQIVLDALDECSERKKLLSWLSSPIAHSTNLLFTSRPEQDIDSSLGEWMKEADIVSIQEGPIDEDIRAVVRAQIATDKDLSRWKTSLETCTMIEDKLMEKAKGM